MSKHKINLQVEFEVDGENVPDFKVEDVAEYATHALHNYEDGRYPYDIETLQHTLKKVLAKAVYDIAYRSLLLQYGDEHIQIDENTSMQKAYMEREKVKLRVYLSDGEDTKFTP